MMPRTEIAGCHFDATPDPIRDIDERHAASRPGPSRPRLGGRGRGGTWATVLAATVLILLLSPAHAVEPSEILPDAALEERARDISKGLRCLVCRNQSIDDSDAPLAKDLRVLVRERLVAGDSDAQVIGYVRERYGDYVLLKPPLTPATFLLWFGGPLLLIAGGVIAWRQIARRPATPAPAPPLSEAERARLREMGIETDDSA